MPKPSEYTPARRRIMQIVMWVILLGTMGLAAVVGESARRANRVELAPQSVTVGDVTAYLPNKWRARPRGDDDPRVIVQAADGAPGEEARTVRVLCDRLEAPMSPLQYLDAAFNVSLPDRGAAGSDGELEFSVTTTTRIAGEPGVLVIVQGLPTRRQQVGKDVYACAILPSLRAIVVHLHGSGEATHQDRAVVNGMAAKIAIANEPATVKGGETLTLADGIEVLVPKAFAAVEEKDPCRSERRLWPMSARQAAPSAKETAQKFESNWTTVQLVGCFAPRGSGGDPKQLERISAALGTMLLARDPAMWRGASIAAGAPNVWRAEPAKPASGKAIVPARAYLLTDGSGAGLLAEFRGGFEGGGFDPDWQAISESVKFPPPPDVNQLRQAGAAEVARLRGAGFEKVLADRQEQWWLWTGPGERPFLGWSHVDLGLSALTGKGESRLRRPGGKVSGITEKFSWNDASGAYRADVTRSDRRGEDVRSVAQVTTLSKDELSVGIREGVAPLTTRKSTSPPQFIPGALLPLLMGKLNLPAGGLLLRTESFVGCDALGTPEPLTILIRPGENATTRKAEGDSEPMRCVVAAVNGSGQRSRWFFRQSGELEYIEFPGGVQRAIADENTVKSDFAQESGMAP